MSLIETRNKLIYLIQGNISIIAGNHPINELGEIFENLCDLFQCLAISRVLIDFDFEGYYRNLIQSGHCRRFFLRKSNEHDNVDDLFLSISRSEALFDVIAAGDFELAKEICTLSPVHWIPDGEYEDNFWYYAFLHEYIQQFENNPQNNKLEQILGQYQIALEDDSLTKYNICWSLFDKNQFQFYKSFTDLIFEREELTTNSPTGWGKEIAETKKYIFIEGLALLEIAKKSKFNIDNEYKFCPLMIMPSSKSKKISDLFQQIDQEFLL